MLNRELTIEGVLCHGQPVIRLSGGSPRLHGLGSDPFDAHQPGVGEHRIARLIRAEGIRPKTVKKWRATTDSAHPYPVVPNTLNGQFAVAKPNRVWAGDITYVWTAEGWPSLAVVLDLYSRRVRAWERESRLTQEWATAAFTMAIERRRPARGVGHQTDRGSQ